MKNRNGKKTAQLVFGILIMLLALILLVSNPFIVSGGWDVSYGMLAVLVFLPGLFLTVAGASKEL